MTIDVVFEAERNNIKAVEQWLCATHCSPWQRLWSVARCCMGEWDQHAQNRENAIWALERSAQYNHVEIVQLLLPYCAVHNTGALELAAKAGHTSVLTMLLDHIHASSLSKTKIKNLCTQALCSATRHGHADCVRLLIPVSDPKAGDSWALRLAAQNGHVECVKLLIGVSDPKVFDSEALRRAAENGHTKCVELLLPHCDAKARESQALLIAVLQGHEACVELLYPVSDVATVLQELHMLHSSQRCANIHLLENRMHAQTCQARLREECNPTQTGVIRIRRKM